MIHPFVAIAWSSICLFELSTIDNGIPTTTLIIL